MLADTTRAATVLLALLLVVTSVNFSLILGFYLFRLWQLLQNDTFGPASVFRLWGVVIALVVVGGGRVYGLSKKG